MLRAALLPCHFSLVVNRGDDAAEEAPGKLVGCGGIHFSSLVACLQELRQFVVSIIYKLICFPTRVCSKTSSDRLGMWTYAWMHIKDSEDRPWSARSGDIGRSPYPPYGQGSICYICDDLGVCLHLISDRLLSGIPILMISGRFSPEVKKSERRRRELCARDASECERET